MTTEQITPKIIQLYGLGRGKTHIGDLLLKSYREQGVACKRYFPGDFNGLTDEDKALDFIIIESCGHELSLDKNPGVTPWQKIFFHIENCREDLQKLSCCKEEVK